jgi:hypothetical protein
VQQEREPLGRCIWWSGDSCNFKVVVGEKVRTADHTNAERSLTFEIFVTPENAVVFWKVKPCSRCSSLLAFRRKVLSALMSVTFHCFKSQLS